MAKLNKQIASGVLWNGLQMIINRSFSFVIKLVLAKLLFPEDFGIVGMAAVFTSFIRVFTDLGIGAALVQKKKENLNENHYHTAFWTGIVWSVFIYILVVLIVAPIAADFYNEPILRNIVPVISLGILSSPINLVHHAKLTRSLNFKKIAYISNFSSIFSGIISLILAFSGAGVWSLVFNSVASIVIGIPMYFQATSWMPKCIWKEKEFKDVFGFGVYTTGTNIFNNLISQIDYLIIGKILSASVLGVYTLAFMLTDIFRAQLMSVMNKVMYPIYGKMQDNKTSVKAYYLKVVGYNSIIVYPIMVLMLILSEPLIVNFFGIKWVDAVVPLKILSLSVMFHMMVNSNTALIRGLGKPKLEMKIQIFKAVLFYMPLIVLGTYYYGIIGTATAILINKIISVFIAQYFLKKLVNIHFLELLSALKAPLIASGFTVIISYVLYEILGVHYILTALILLLSYFLILYLLMKDELNGLLIKLKDNFYDKNSFKGIQK